MSKVIHMCASNLFQMEEGNFKCKYLNKVYLTSNKLLKLI